jgi:acetyl-CoA/propionyl-CoA carboxylase biotin carboxyl carrier protein
VFDTVLVANRGEIAVRIIRTLRALGIRSVAVYSDADAEALHVRMADHGVRIGPEAAQQSYLNIDAVIAAAVASGAQAIHPGCGFLAENADFAAACAAAGLVFVGPSVAVIETMGDKIRAKQAAVAAGVPTVPGRAELGMDDAALAEAAAEIGYPVLVKPAAGGGGKGIHLVTAPAELAAIVSAARREARGSFGDDALFVERFLRRPRHLEIQLLADQHGAIVHLGERECSLQRRFQKVVEEAPSPLLDEATRDAMGASAIAVAKAVGYTSAGTVEFIVSADNPREFFFMEMNTRLQVEHPVTEQLTGLDLVAWQLRIAAGEPLDFRQADVVATGHSIEARIYAEDPQRGFLPTGGRLLTFRAPQGNGVRVDAGVTTGELVGSSYDPLLAKVVVHGPDRMTALGHLRQALAETTVLGVVTNVGFLLRLLNNPEVEAGRLSTDLIENELETLIDQPIDDHALAAAALDRLATLTTPDPARADPWEVADGWRLGERAWTSWTFEAGDRVARICTQGEVGEVLVSVDGSTPSKARLDSRPDQLVVTYAGITRAYDVARQGKLRWLAAGGDTWRVIEQPTIAATGRARNRDAGGRVLSPMPGTVVSVLVEVGESVVAGQSLVVVEAMKMEHTLVAPSDGSVMLVAARVGSTVAMDQLLVEIEAVTP